MQREKQYIYTSRNETFLWTLCTHSYPVSSLVDLKLKLKMPLINAASLKALKVMVFCKTGNQKKKKKKK